MYLDLRGAANYLRRSESWLYKRVHKKEIPFLKPDGKLLFVRNELDLWVVNKKSTKETYLSKFEMAKERIRSLTTETIALSPSTSPQSR